MDLLEKLLLALAAAIVVFTAYAFYETETSEKIILIKSEWQCIDEQTHIRYQSTKIGNSTMLMPIPYTSCSNYKRIVND